MVTFSEDSQISDILFLFNIESSIDICGCTIYFYRISRERDIRHGINCKMVLFNREIFVERTFPLKNVDNFDIKLSPLI